MWTSSREALILAPLLVLGPYALAPDEGVLHAQTLGPADHDPLARSSVLLAAVVQEERERALVESYAAASAEAREIANQILRAGRDPRRSRLGSLNLATIAAARRALEGGEPGAELAPWADLVDSLELRVVPGLFAAREEGLGEPMTVTIDNLWKAQVDREPEGGLEISLIWVSPAGERHGARTEPVSLGALLGGFEMYIRPPVSGPGIWSLVADLRTSMGPVSSAPVAVECVADLAGLRAGRPSGAEGVLRTSERELARRVSELEQFGLRRSAGLSLAEWYAAGQGAAGVLAPRPFEPPVDELGNSSGFEGAVMWEVVAGEAPVRRTFLLLAGNMEHPTELLTGAVGRAWARVAETQGARVLAARVPLPGGPHFDPCAFATALKRETKTEQLVVVARGDHGRVLPGFLGREPCVAIDGLVLSETPAAGASLPDSFALPALSIELSAPEPMSEGVETGAPRARVRLYAPAPTGVLAAPDLIAAWAGKL